MTHSYIKCYACQDVLIHDDGHDTIRYDESNPPLFLCGPCGARKRQVEIAYRKIIRAALAFDSCMAEFGGDPACCGENLNALYAACDGVRDNPFEEGE